MKACFGECAERFLGDGVILRLDGDGFCLAVALGGGPLQFFKGFAHGGDAGTAAQMRVRDRHGRLGGGCESGEQHDADGDGKTN